MTAVISNINDWDDQVVTRFSKSSIVMKITPEIAAEMLVHNTGNRKLRPTVVAQYATDMREGRWHHEADSPIVFDWNGRLINGQHRLQACIKAETPFIARVNRGVDPAAYDVMDQGFRRTAGDALTKKGVIKGTNMAAAYRVVYAYRTGRLSLANEQGMGQAAFLTNSQVVAGVLAEEELLQHAGLVAERVYRHTKYNKPAVTALVVLAINEGHSRQLVEEFMDGLGSGANMSEGDPRLSFRRWWVNSYKRSSIAVLAALIRAFNAYANNQQLKLIKINTAGVYPRIVSANDLF